MTTALETLTNEIVERFPNAKTAEIVVHRTRTENSFGVLNIQDQKWVYDPPRHRLTRIDPFTRAISDEPLHGIAIAAFDAFQVDLPHEPEVSYLVVDGYWYGLRGDDMAQYGLCYLASGR